MDFIAVLWMCCPHLNRVSQCHCDATYLNTVWGEGDCSSSSHYVQVAITTTANRQIVPANTEYIQNWSGAHPTVHKLYHHQKVLVPQHSISCQGCVTHCMLRWPVNPKLDNHSIYECACPLIVITETRCYDVSSSNSRAALAHATCLLIPSSTWSDLGALGRLGPPQTVIRPRERSANNTNMRGRLPNAAHFNYICLTTVLSNTWFSLVNNVQKAVRYSRTPCHG